MSCDVGEVTEWLENELCSFQLDSLKIVEAFVFRTGQTVQKVKVKGIRTSLYTGNVNFINFRNTYL